MTRKDWQDMTVFAVFTMLLHSMKARFVYPSFFKKGVQCQLF